MSEVILQVENLKKHFVTKKGLFKSKNRVLKAVDGISLSIRRGESFALVGESGCGKSTAGRTILGLLEPTAGKVVFEGQTLYDVENQAKLDKKNRFKLRKDMQLIFQDPFASLDPRMNIGQIVSEGIMKHKMAKPKEALDLVAQMLERCGLESGVMERYPHEFSGGQRQRIGIARALVMQPKFIVADEPIAALDVSIQAQILNLMTDLKAQFGLTYLFISHDLEVVRYFCDQVAVMYLGSIVEKAAAKALYKEPLHPYTKALLSAIPKSHPKLEKQRILLKGEMPSPVNPPSGCKFHNRCPYAREVCMKVVPLLEEVSEDHFVACHRWQEIGS